ncbi:hypothetical protein ACFYWS_04530 [Streptomyces sp. NPDC002795]
MADMLHRELSVAMALSGAPRLDRIGAELLARDGRVR